MAATITDGMEKLSVGKPSVGKSSTKSGKPPLHGRIKTNKLAAFVTIGRWQPPHMGHFLLIDGLYRKAMDDGMAEAFVYVTDKIKVKPESGWVSENWDTYNMKNPLTGIQKLYYLSLMFPAEEYPNLKFLVGFDINPVDGLLRNFTRNYPYPVKKSTTLKEIQSLYTLTSDTLLSSIGIDLFQKIKNLKHIGTSSLPFGDRVIRINARNAKLSPSTACISFLSGRGYKTMQLLVGSDRVEAFTKYNATALENSFRIAGSVGQLGGERGVAGSGKLFEVKIQARRASKGLDFCDGTTEEEEICSTISVTDGKFSGTNIRNHCYLFETTERGNIINLLEGIKINKMSPLDCVCLINDVRLGSKFNIFPRVITIDTWNERNALIGKKGSIIHTPMDDNSSELVQLLETNSDTYRRAFKEQRAPQQKRISEEKKVRPSSQAATTAAAAITAGLVPSQYTTKIPNRPISGEEDGNMGQAQLPLQGGGTRKRKKKKRRRRKTKRNRKRRKNKHSRKRKRKRRRKRKTRRN